MDSLAGSREETKTWTFHEVEKHCLRGPFVELIIGKIILTLP